MDGGMMLIKKRNSNKSLVKIICNYNAINCIKIGFVLRILVQVKLANELHQSIHDKQQKVDVYTQMN